MKAILILTILTFILVSVAVYAVEKEESKEKASAGKMQTICPVMKMEINKERFVDYQGKRIYFCCDKCPVMFLGDPDKYMKALKEQDVTLEDTPKPQKMCPVMEMEAEKEHFVDYQGKRIYFCCDK